MCFYINIKTLEKKTPTLIEDNLYTIDVKVIILQTTNQSNFSIKKLVVKVNDIVLFISFSLLTFFYFNRLILEILLICEKKVYLIHTKLTKLM